MIPIAVVTICLVALAFILAMIVRAMSEQRHIAARLETLVTSPAPVDQRSALLDALKGERAPGIALPDLDGTRVMLDALLAPGKPLMLVFAEPRCGPCYEILPDLGDWQRTYSDHLTIALVSSGTLDTNEAMVSPYDIAPVLLQHDMEVVVAYGLAQAPAAVLIQPDGRIAAGPRYGTRAIRQLVADTLGLTLPPAPATNVTPVGIGATVPPVRRPDLRGNVVDLVAPRDVPTMVLFWSPGCTHCQALAPAIRSVERHPHHPDMIIVSRGPIGLTEDAGFVSPVVFDDDRVIARTFGVEATPSAVVIDDNGRVASPVIRGAPSIQAVLERISPAEDVVAQNHQTPGEVALST